MVSVNLLPEHLIITQVRRRRTRRWIIACLLSGVVAAIPLGLESYRIARAEELTATNDRLSREMASVETELSDIVVASQEAFLQIERAKALRSKRSWSAILGLLSDAMPAGCWLTELSTDPPFPTGATRQTIPTDPRQAKDPPATVIIEAPRKLRIVGFASDAAEPLEFLDRLKAAGVFANVASQGVRREPLGGAYYFRFELECIW